MAVQSFFGWMGKLLLIISLVSTLAACGHDSNNHAPTVVKTDKGMVKGKETAAMREFLGIPYAAPPVGDLRWEPPQPTQPWSGTLEATHFANHCPQTDSPFGQPSTTEDCLYLNVFAPRDKGAYPVMVWIHGGAFIDGESDDYDPSPLVKQDVVVVTLNYRLGILGFLAHPALADSGGDYGIMDQQAALRWVQRNIAGFGGNPDNVTVFGVSAGGLSVLTQILSPKAEGLFQKAIVESGSYSLVPPLRKVSLDLAQTLGKDFARKVKCNKQTPEQTAECLRNMPAGQIVKAQSESPLRFVPNIRAGLLPRSMLEALESGQFNQVPMIEGSNRNEWRLFVALEHDLTPNGPIKAADYVSAIQSTLLISKDDAQTIAQEYPLSDYPSADLAMAAVGTDAAFACNSRTEIRGFSHYVSVHAYEFNDPKAPEIILPTKPVTFPFASAHSSEIQYFFDFFNPEEILAAPSVLSPKQKKLSHAIIDYWTRFAHTGNPNPDSGAITYWPKYNSEETFLSLMPPSPQTISDAQFAREHHCDFWSNFRRP